ncbi:MAG: acetylglucosamine-6-sulfatase, partial [Verrucomicrobiota bacterium]
MSARGGGIYDNVKIDPPRLNDPAIFESQRDYLKTAINHERFYWRWNTPQELEEIMRASYRMVSGIDGAIVRSMKVLEEEGLAD